MRNCEPPSAALQLTAHCSLPELCLCSLTLRLGVQMPMRSLCLCGCPGSLARHLGVETLHPAPWRRRTHGPGGEPNRSTDLVYESIGIAEKLSPRENTWDRTRANTNTSSHGDKFAARTRRIRCQTCCCGGASERARGMCRLVSTGLPQGGRRPAGRHTGTARPSIPRTARSCT